MTAPGARPVAITGARIAGPGAELLPTDGPMDVLLDRGRIVDIAPAGALRIHGEVLAADGAWLVPGLWDHHVHVGQWALTGARVPLHGARTAAEAAGLVASAPVDDDGRRVGTGIRDALWPDAPSLEVLDRATGGIPSYLLGADAHSVWLNTAALAREGVRSEDGMLREAPAFDVLGRLNDVGGQALDRAVTRMAREAAARGVVGVRDFDFGWNLPAWRRRVEAGFDLLRVEAGFYADDLARVVDAGLRSGDAISEADSELVTVGALKVISDGSLGTRTAACSHPYTDGSSHGGLNIEPVALAELLGRAAAAGISCAVHAIGDIANTHALDAFAHSGAWGTIEHAQLVRSVDVPRFARLGIAASVQPQHALDDRALSDGLWAEQTAIVYPLRTLAAAGANLRFGSDAPVAPLDPWRAIAAATLRSEGAETPWHPEETLDLASAIAASTHGGSTAPDRIAVGERADLALLPIDPRLADAAALRSMRALATVVAGRVTHAL